MKKTAPIGVIDSGVGGLTVLKCLYKNMPHEDFIYLGDTARTPYGTRSGDEVRKFTRQMLDWLEKQGVKLVVIACNTITVTGVDELAKGRPFDIVGMSKGEHLVLNASKNKKIGVLATEFTISTGAHKKAILAVDSAADVHPMPCPKFVPLIEGEQFGSDALKEAIAEYTRPLIKDGVDTIILSCTHFPFVADEIKAAVGAGVTIIDPAEETAANAAAVLKAQGLERTEGQGSVKICCTADVDRVRRLAARMMDENSCRFEQINLF